MIFLSYRRSDSDDRAGRLHDRLARWFDADDLFYDKRNIDSGDRFPAEIDAALDRASVVLVLIGPGWLAELNRRVDQPEIDFVRREITGALARGKPVLPLLLGGAVGFAASALAPGLRDELAALCDIDPLRFPDRDGKLIDYDNRFVQLRQYLADLPQTPLQRYLPPDGVEQIRRLIDHQLSPHFRDPNELLPQLHAQLAAQGRTALVARTALYGMGGIGKTQLALKYSLDYADRYAGVWWFRAESEDGLQLDAQECCQRVGASIEHGERPSAALKCWLERQTAPWLLVFDNAEHADSLRPHLPQGHTHRIIVTSRDPNWRGLLPQALELEIWSPEQGAAFLAARLPEQAEADLRALSADLGGLPLALEQAGAYIESTGVSVAAYRKLLAAIDTEGMILDEGRAATGYEHSVLKTLTLACDKLGPAATEALRLLAYAAPEAFAERFLREAARELPAALAEAVANDLRWNRVVAELRAYGLVTRSMLPAWAEGAGEEAALSLHRLTQQAMRARFAEPDRDCAALQSVLRVVCPQDPRLPAHWPRYAALLPHITHLDRYLDARWLDRRRHSWLLNQVAHYLQVGPALYAESTGWFRRALDINRADLGEKHPNTLATMNNLALTLQAQGDLASALELEKSALAIQRRILGDEHPDTFTAMSNLALTLYAQGDLAGTLALQKSALALRRRILGDEHPDTLQSMNNLAFTLYAQGDLVGALDLQKSALAIHRRILGDEHPDTLTAMGNLACTLKVQGDLDGALALEKSALALRRRILGDAHPDTLISAWNLFGTALELNDAATANDLFETFIQPLLHADLASLPASSKSIRDQLLAAIESAP